MRETPPHLKLVIMGKMGAGKTTASNHLVEEYGAVSWTIAERIKQVSHALVGQAGDLGSLLQRVTMSPELAEKATLALLRFREGYQEEAGKPRRLYQEVGQILRDLDPRLTLCWEHDLQRRIENSPRRFTVVDIRSKESYGFFCSQGYSSLRIDAPLEVRKQRLLLRDHHALIDERLFTHQSETDVDELEFDYVLDNADNESAAFLKRLDELVVKLESRAV